MTNWTRSLVDRRGFLKASGVVLVTSATGIAVARLRPSGSAAGAGAASGLRLAGAPTKEFYLAATDGWASLGDPSVIAPIAPFWPDPAAPSPYDVWIMGFLDVSDVHTSVEKVFARKQQAQFSAPLMYIDEGDNFAISLRNLGLKARPDLIDSHTLHFHGFPNQTPYFDGVPDSSLAAPIGRELVYQYIPEDAGTYMYHCHFEDVEHVHMGLQGQVFVQTNRAKLAQILGADYNPSMGYAYYNKDTAFNRQFSIHLDEVDVHTHYNDAHLQISDWSAYSANFRTMNGRTYPDTLIGNRNSLHPGAYSSAETPQDPVIPSGYPERLHYNPLSALIQGESGERILVRVSNLGYEEHSLVLDGLEFTVVGNDAKNQLSGRADYYGSASRGNISKLTNRIDIGPGESRDLIIVAPTVTAKTVFPFYDRNYGFVATQSGGSQDSRIGGMRTEVRIWPQGTFAGKPQTAPHQLVDPL